MSKKVKIQENESYKQISIFDFQNILPDEQLSPAEEYYRDTGKTDYWQASNGKPYQFWKEKSQNNPSDMHSDRYGRLKPAPKWMRYERCENCIRWTMYPTEQQPPDGWGIYGWCAENKYKCKATNFCKNFEDKNT